MKKPILIKELEKALGLKLLRVPNNSKLMTRSHRTCYSIDEKGSVLGFNLLLRKNNQPILIDYSFLSNFPNLEYLNLSDNQIKNVSFLKNLRNLTELNLRHNKIDDISFLQSLTGLTNLNLERNQITDISFLQNLTGLTNLNLINNQITDIFLGFLNQFPQLETLYLKGNPIQKIPQEVFNKYENCLPALRDYFKSIEEHGASKVFHLKMVLVGNGRAGKTSLLRRWLDGQFDANEASTHAIQQRVYALDELPRQAGLDDARLNIWDLGGQDIYHATHRLFMQTKALFLVVWDKESEQQPTHIDILPTGETTEYQNFQLPYWLAFAKKYDTENAVFLVRTKATKHGAYTLPNANNLYTEYRIANDTNTDAQDGKGYADFKEKLHDIITQQMEQRFPLMPTQWWKVQQAVEREAAAGKNILAKAEFIAFCKAENLDESNQRTLLNYLHNTGTFFYDETRFGNTVILNQQWAIDAIYTLFERGSVHRETILRAKGRFTQQHLAAAWQQYDDKTQNLFLAFMQSCDVCFTYPDSKKEGVETFIAPALMPEKKSEETQSDWEEKDDNEYFIRYAHPFLHYGIIQRFIVETHQYAKTVSIWKNGTVIKDSSNKALIEAEFGAENPCILVRVRGNNPKSLLDKIRNKLQEIEGKTAFQLSFSLDGEKYEKEEIVERYQLPKYAVFMGRNEDVRFEGNKLDRILEFVKRIDQTTTETHDNVKVIQITLAAFYQSLNDIKKGITDLDTDIAGLTKLHEALDKGSASIATEQSFQTFLNTIKSEWFGGDVKLKDGSLRDLAAALYYYNAQKDRADMMDYSAIVLHLGKAVEFELNERIKNKLIEVCIESETKRIENKDIKTKRLKRTVTLGDASKLKEELQKVCNKNFPFSLGVMYGCFQDIDKLLKSPNENTVKGLFDAVFTNPNAVFEKHQSNNDFYYTLMYELKHGAKSIPAFRNTSAHSGSIIRKAQAEKYINTVKTFLKEWNKALK